MFEIKLQKGDFQNCQHFPLQIKQLWGQRQMFVKFAINMDRTLNIG